jgi:hypothetical protein
MRLGNYVRELLGILFCDDGKGNTTMIFQAPYIRLNCFEMDLLGAQQ